VLPNREGIFLPPKGSYDPLDGPARLAHFLNLERDEVGSRKNLENDFPALRLPTNSLVFGA
jgi:hypothetical protein